MAQITWNNLSRGGDPATASLDLLMAGQRSLNTGIGGFQKMIGDEQQRVANADAAIKAKQLDDLKYGLLQTGTEGLQAGVDSGQFLQMAQDMDLGADEATKLFQGVLATSRANDEAAKLRTEASTLEGGKGIVNRLEAMALSSDPAAQESAKQAALQYHRQGTLPDALAVPLFKSLQGIEDARNNRTFNLEQQVNQKDAYRKAEEEKRIVQGVEKDVQGLLTKRQAGLSDTVMYDTAMKQLVERGLPTAALDAGSKALKTALNLGSPTDTVGNDAAVADKLTKQITAADNAKKASAQYEAEALGRAGLTGGFYGNDTEGTDAVTTALNARIPDSTKDKNLQDAKSYAQSVIGEYGDKKIPANVMVSIIKEASLENSSTTGQLLGDWGLGNNIKKTLDAYVNSPKHLADIAAISTIRKNSDKYRDTLYNSREATKFAIEPKK